jgi:sensor histidine kinase YesM
MNNLQIITHLLAWVGIVSYEWYMPAPIYTWGHSALFSVACFLLSLQLFYCNFFALSKYYALKSFFNCAFVLMLSFVIYITLSVKIYSNLKGMKLDYIWVLIIFKGLLLQAASSICWFIQYNMRLINQQYLSEQQVLVEEIDVYKNELKVLKAKFIPKNLFDSLNFLYAQSHLYPEKATKAICLLTETMHYILDDYNQDKIKLKIEIQHIINYIELNQLRFHESLQIKFEYDYYSDSVVIAPFVLISLVENCFKHGELNNINDPIRINLSVSQNELIFFTCNRKRLGPKENSVGVKQIDLHKYLKNAYSDKYKLFISNTESHYICQLSIILEI